MSLSGMAIDRSDADLEDIEECLDQIEAMKEEHPEAYSIAMFYNDDQLRHDLERRMEG